MSDNIIPFTTAVGRGGAGSDGEKRRQEIIQRRQELVSRVRQASEKADSTFERREDRIPIAQEIDRLITDNKLKPRHLREVLQKNKVPNIHLERLRLDYRLPPLEARKEGSKGLARTIQPYIQILDALAELLGQHPDDVVFTAFRNTSFVRPGRLVENNAADELNFRIQEMTRGIIRAERLSEYFKMCRTVPALFDGETREFCSDDSPALKPLFAFGSGLPGYEDEYERVWENPVPLPAVQLLRVPRVTFSGPLVFEKKPIASSSLSAPDVSRLMKANRVWRVWPELTRPLLCVPPLGATGTIHAEIMISHDIRLVIAPRRGDDDLGPLFEQRSYVEMKVGGRACELTFPFSVAPLVWPYGDDFINPWSFFVAAKFEDGWHRVTGMSAASWTSNTDDEIGDGGWADDGGYDSPLEFDPLIETFGRGLEFTVQWIPVSASTVAELMDVFAKYCGDRDDNQPSASILLNPRGPYPPPPPEAYICPAHCNDLETALSTGALEEALIEDCKYLRGKLDKRAEEANSTRESHRNALLSRWRNMGREPQS